MASPQKENGYTAIANELFEAMAKTPLNGTQFRILNVVIRQTYGFNRKNHDLSESFISKATGIHEKQINREIKKLIEFRIISVIREASYTASRILALNKNWEEWEPTKTLPPNEIVATLPTNPLPVHPTNPLPVVPTNPLPKERHIKDNYKDILEHFEKLWALYPRKLGKGSVKDAKKKELYSVSFDEMVRAINRYKADIEKNNTEERYIKHGSTFFNSGYLDYLDSNFKEPEPVPLQIVRIAPKGVTVI